MAVTDLGVVQDQIQKFWAPLFMDELRANLPAAAILNKEYSGQIKDLGDEVTVSQIDAPEGQLKTVGTDADTFDSDLMSVREVKVKADKRAVASFEIADLAMLQSQIGAQDSSIRAALEYAVAKKINAHIHATVAPSTSAPDHLLNSTSSMDASVLASVRKLAGQAKWQKDGKWYGLLDPKYYSDLLNASTLASSDYVQGDMPVVAGDIGTKRFGFQLLEDNSMGVNNAGVGLFLHPDAMLMVMQQQPRFKVSDLHPMKKFGFLISVDVVFGLKLSVDGAKKHIVVTAASSGNDIT